MSQVKLAFLVQHRILEILLQDKSPQLAISVPFPSIEPYFYIVERVADSDTIPPVSVFSGLADPHVFEGGFGALGFFVLFHEGMVVQEVFPLGVFRAFFEMESVGDDLEGVFALELIEAFDVVEEGLFVANIVIAFEMVVDFQQV